MSKPSSPSAPDSVSLNTGGDEAVSESVVEENPNAKSESDNPKKVNINVNVPELVNLSCNLLHQGFIKNKKEHARSMYKDLKNGKNIIPGAITIGDKLELNLKLALDVSAFKGPSLSFPAFEIALKSMLVNLGDKLKNKKDLNILTSENGAMLFNCPGVVQTTETQFNVMVMTIEPQFEKKELILRLLFVNPDQFEKKEVAE